MPAECQNIIIFKGSTKAYELKFTNRNTGAVEDLTDWTIYFTAKQAMDDSDDAAKINKKITSHSDPTNGKTLIELTTSDTDLDPGTYYYSVDYKDDDGNIGTLFHGRIKIVDSVRDTKG